MRYLSLFTGIGGFEQAIHALYPNAQCVAFSEIDPYAIQIYTYHYPNHFNLGDITKITKEQIKNLQKIDLVVGGFPCTNLSSMATIRGNSDGLQGPKSRLFYDMLNILNWVQEYNPKIMFVIENNYSMKKEWKEIITQSLQSLTDNIYCHMINNAMFGVQTRKRLIWTNFPFEPPTVDQKFQTWDDILEPLQVVENNYLSDSMINCLNKIYPQKTKRRTKVAIKQDNGRYTFDFIEMKGKSRWDIQSRSDNMIEQEYKYPVGKSRPITAGVGGGNNVILDRRGGSGFIPRTFTMLEIERLFGFPDNYTAVQNISKSRRHVALGNSVPIFVVRHVLNQLILNTQ